MGHKTSVYLEDELYERWKASRRPLAGLIEDGLRYEQRIESRQAEPGAAHPRHTGGDEGIVRQVPGVIVSADLAADVRKALDQLGQIISLLGQQGYVIVPRDELRALIATAVAATGPLGPES